jgi:hypothetical protein
VFFFYLVLIVIIYLILFMINYFFIFEYFLYKWSTYDHLILSFNRYFICKVIENYDLLLLKTIWITGVRMLPTNSFDHFLRFINTFLWNLLILHLFILKKLVSYRRWLGEAGFSYLLSMVFFHEAFHSILNQLTINRI